MLQKDPKPNPSKVNAEMWSWASHVPKNKITAQTFSLQCQLKVMSLFRVKQIFPKKPNPVFTLVLAPSSETTGCKHIRTGTNTFINDLSVPLYQGGKTTKKKHLSKKRDASIRFILLRPGFSLSGLQDILKALTFVCICDIRCSCLGNCIKIHLWNKKEDMNYA